MQSPMLSHKASRFTESVIRGMSVEAARHGAVNLAQGMPDFAAPAAVKDAACLAIQADVNQYAITWGAREPPPRDRRACRLAPRLTVDPETEITVTCGSTEAMLVALLSLINPGDEVILTQPFYENYWPDCVLAGATPRLFRCTRPTGGLIRTNSPSRSTIARKPSCSAILIIRPGRCSRRRMEVIAALCQKWDVVAISDEIYEHIVYDGRARRRASRASTA